MSSPYRHRNIVMITAVAKANMCDVKYQLCASSHFSIQLIETR